MIMLNTPVINNLIVGLTILIITAIAWIIQRTYRVHKFYDHVYIIAHDFKRIEKQEGRKHKRIPFYDKLPSREVMIWSFAKIDFDTWFSEEDKIKMYKTALYKHKEYIFKNSHSW